MAVIFNGVTIVSDKQILDDTTPLSADGSTLTLNRTDGSTSTVDIGQHLGTTTIKAISYNAQNISENIVIPGTVNALSAGPITIDTGKTVTVSTGATWTVV